MCSLESWLCYEKRMIHGIVVARRECEDCFTICIKEERSWRFHKSRAEEPLLNRLLISP